MAGNKRWTSSDVKLLRQKYGKADISVLCDELNRSADAIHYKASKLNIQFKRNDFVDFGISLEKIQKEIESLNLKMDSIINIFYKSKRIPLKKEQEEYILENYMQKSFSDMSRESNIPLYKIQRFLSTNGLKKNELWKEEEVQFLKENYKKYDINFISKKLDKTKKSIQSKAFIMGIAGIKNPRYSDEDILFIVNNYKKMTIAELAAKMDRDIGSIGRKMQILRKKGVISYKSEKMEKLFMLKNNKNE